MLLAKKSVGLDIADRTIEAAEISGSGSRFKIVNLGRIKLEAGIVERGMIKDETKLKQAVNRVFTEARPKPITSRKVIFGLPEGQTFLRTARLGPHEKRDRERLVLEEVKANIPLEENDLLFSYRILRESREETKILMAAASRQVVEQWARFFKGIKIEPEVFDIEILAVFRGLRGRPSSQMICLADIGSATSYLAIFNESGLSYERAVNIAGDDFTAAVAAQLKNNNWEEAEARKIAVGLKNKDKKIVEALRAELDLIIEEIKIFLAYAREQEGQAAAEMILVGGSSQMLGLADYFKSALNLPVGLGAAGFAGKTPLEYWEAIGLALRKIDKKWDKIDPNIPIQFS